MLATRIGALLDFYSDRAVAHASFFIASIFGLATLLAIIQRENVWVSVPVFFVFSYMGYYTLVRFNFYASIAGELNRGISDVVPFRQTTFRNYVQEREESQQRILILRRIIAGRGIYILGLMYWVLIVLLGYIVYSRFWYSSIEVIGWFAFLAILILVFVLILPERPRQNLSRTIT